MSLSGRMAQGLALVLAGYAFAAPVSAQQLQADVKASAPSGFTVVASVVTDKDWEKRWNTRTPGVSFDTSDTLKQGQSATIIVMFSNARSVNGRSHLLCDVTIHGTSPGHEQQEPPTPCFDGPTPPSNVLALTAMTIGITVDRGDKPSIEQFDIGVRDTNGGGRVPVRLVVSEAPAI